MPKSPESTAGRDRLPKATACRNRLPKLKSRTKTRTRCIAFTSVFVLLALAICFLPVNAQQLKPSTISYEGQKVSSVVLAGRPDLNTRQLKHLIAQPINAPYSQQKIDETVAALRKTGQFTDVQLDVRPQSTGLQVLFVLQPAMYFGVYDFGNAGKVFSYNRMLQVSDYAAQEPYSTERIEEAESNMLTFFHRTGFFMATIEPKLQTDASHGVVNVFFDINLKRRAKFGNIILTGTTEEETKRLQHRLRSVWSRMRGVSLRSGNRYSLEKLEKATNNLQATLGKQHYLSSRVQFISSNYNPQTNRANVTFQINTGPIISIKTEGAHVWGRTMKKLIPIYQENSVDPDLVQEGRRNLVSYFQGKGYFHVKVQSHNDQQPSGTTIVYQIDKGPRGKVGSIHFSGNQHFDSEDLLPHVTVTKAHFLSRGKYSEYMLRKSANNLETFYQNSGYSQVKVIPAVTEDQGRLAITFQIQEGPLDVVNSLRIEGNTIPESELAPGGLNLGPGNPYSGQLLDKDRDQIMATYLRRGYLTAAFKATAKPLKEDPQNRCGLQH